MKKVCILAVCMLLISCIPDSMALAWSEDDFAYWVEDGNAIITEIYLTGDVVIPDVIDGYPVTEIREGALVGYSGIDSVFIPASVTKIGVQACPDIYDAALGFITVDENNPSYASKDGILYNKDFTTLVCVPPLVSSWIDEDELVILDGVTTIAAYAFCNSNSFYKISLPDSVTTIEDYAFSGISWLNSISIPKTVSHIGQGAFCECPDLQSIAVSADNPNFTSQDGILYDKAKTCLIGYPAGKKATSYSVPEGIASIGAAAFSGCEHLQTVILPDSLTTLGTSAFRRCFGLISIELPDGVTQLPFGSFSNCFELQSIRLPKNLKTIGMMAFSSCYSLPSITLPDSVTAIGESAFSNCASLKTIRLPEGLTALEYGTFNSCESLESVYIPHSVTEIDDSFTGVLYRLKHLYIPSSVKTVSLNDLPRDAILHCEKGSEAEQYAIDKDIPYILVCPPKDEAGNRLTIKNLAQAREIRLDKQYMALNGDSARLMMAAYDNGGTLLNAQSIDAAPYDTGDTFVLPNHLEPPAGTAYIKIYVWQSPQALLPACVPFEIL